MRSFILASILAAGSAASAVAGGVSVQVNFGAPYYGYAPADVVYVQRYVPAYDVPRVFFAARYGRVAPAVIVNCYRDGWGWDRIHSRYRVPRGGYYSARPVYGNSFRRDRDRDRWDDRRGKGRRGRGRD